MDSPLLNKALCDRGAEANPHQLEDQVKEKSTKGIIRIAIVKNRATGRDVLERVTADGRLTTRAAKHLGVRSVKSWTEVEAESWAQATKMVRAGKGTKGRAS